MNYEKMYKEALERMKSWMRGEHSECFSEAKKTAEFIFPELKDSEDEKIRKYIIWHLKHTRTYPDNSINNSVEEAISWLEKQGEKSADKIQLGKKYKCIASPIYSTFKIGEIYKPEDKFLCSLMNFCSDCFEPIKDNEQNPTEKADVLMSLDEAIEHCNKVSEAIATSGCEECAKEHKQLADWLNELKELKEQNPAWSEEDKRIQKEIIAYLDVQDAISNRKGQDFKCWIAWLEKQGETSFDEEWIKLLKNANIQYQMSMNEDMADEAAKLAVDGLKKLNIYEIVERYIYKQGENENKPFDKAEPKFKVGDWILYSGDHFESVRHITKIDEDGYYIERNGLPHGIIPFNHEICMRLWTIQDAKDGDVLKEDSCLFIIERMKPDGTAIVHCCLFDDGDFDLVGSNLSFDVDSTYPAAKEQRKFLFSKIKEAGYEWDAEKKELKKIKQNTVEWSEEDEYQINTILHGLDLKKELYKKEGNKVEEERYSTQYDWLKSLKDRVQHQPKQDWSE